jgi:HTH-type transcriptional regulator, global nitrogen regulator NrpRI
MDIIPSERKCLEILRILKEQREPMGAKRLSELMAEHGFVLSDRAVQYYLRYLDEREFTVKVGNLGRVLTTKGQAETESAMVEERIGFIISKLERLAFRTTFDPESGTGDVAYNLSYVPEEEAPDLAAAFDEVIRAEAGFFSSYKIVENEPRVPKGSVGFITLCSVTMDGVFQRHGIPVKMAYGGRLAITENRPSAFVDLMGYRGTTVDPLQLFISAGLTKIHQLATTGTGIAVANVREVPTAAREQVEYLTSAMRENGFVLPVAIGNQVLNLRSDPFHLSVVAFSGMNLIGNGVERGCRIKTEIGAGNIPFSKVIDAT